MAFFFVSDLMPVTSSTSLKAVNTFGLDQQCSKLVIISTYKQLVDHCLAAYQDELPMLILGEGSNLLLSDDFDGTVIKLETKGIQIKETDDAYLLTVAAGENWHDLVEFTLQNNMLGLENMALIPGTVGAAPIQNIGAYGVEFCQVCDWVEYLDLETGESHRLTASQCLFGYRDSIFKNALKNKIVITYVGLKLPKQWQPNLSYGPLREFELSSVTASEIFNKVCEVRSSKLPNPAKLGNAGSFFKNPVVDVMTYQRLAHEFPGIVGYAMADGKVKLAAGWLIEQAGLKGYQANGAGVHCKQALVLVNHGDATGASVCALARHVIARVNHKFGVELEPEPRIIGRYGEVEIANV